jgi:hypothetical protein
MLPVKMQWRLCLEYVHANEAEDRIQLPNGQDFGTPRAGARGASAFVKDGITANAIAPALIETDMVTSNPNANPNLIPMGHFGSVDDVASVAVMLAMNDYMTGQTISVNGGWYMS